MHLQKQIGVLLISLGLVACGYFQAGTWEDDPKNWYRAFGEKLPPEVELAHSLYTRMPHFTHEHIFYLEFKADREFMSRMIARYNLIEHKTSDGNGSRLFRRNRPTVVMRSSSFVAHTAFPSGSAFTLMLRNFNTENS